MLHDIFELHLIINRFVNKNCIPYNYYVKRDLLHSDYVESHMENDKVVFNRVST